MSGWDRVDAALRRVTRAIAVAGLLLLALNGALTVLNVLLRWLANAPLDGLDDISSVAIVLAVAACLPATLAGRFNITIRALEGVLGPRGREALEALGAALTAAVFVLIVWKIAGHTLEMKANGRTLPGSTHPLYPYWMGVTALLALALAVQVWVVAYHARRALGRPPAR